jgi:hypothetical protein
LAVSDGEEKEIQGKRVRITTLDISLAHQPLIDPAELRGGLRTRAGHSSRLTTMVSSFLGYGPPENVLP